MTDPNLAIWSRLERTDPAQTKAFTRAGGFKGTATRPVYLVKKMTEVFGPCGTGWGYSEPTFQIVNGAGAEVAVYCWLSVWYVEPVTGVRSEGIAGVGGDFIVKTQKSGPFTDDEAFKKAFTDALGNAMKHLGMSADVHMGLFDGSKYREEPRPTEPEAAPTSIGPSRNLTKALTAMRANTTFEDLMTWYQDTKSKIALLSADDQAEFRRQYGARQAELDPGKLLRAG